jgi:hypothetical protein
MAFATNYRGSKPFGPASLTGYNQAITEVSATKHYALGTIVQAVDPVFGVGEFIYATGVASTAIGEPISLCADFTTTRATGGTAVGQICVAMSACVASKYGWYCIKGRCLGVIAGNMAVVSGSFQASIVANVWSTAVTATKIVFRATATTGLLAGGSAVEGTDELTPAGFMTLNINYPVAVLAV